MRDAEGQYINQVTYCFHSIKWQKVLEIKRSGGTCTCFLKSLSFVNQIIWLSVAWLELVFWERNINNYSRPWFQRLQNLTFFEARMVVICGFWLCKGGYTLWAGLLIIRAVADPRNSDISAKFPKKHEIPRNPPEIFRNACRQNTFNTYLGY